MREQLRRWGWLAAVVVAASASAGPVAGRHRPAPVVVPATTGRPSAPPQPLPPNEMGRVMIMMYHRLGDKNSLLVRTPASFRNDLALLYRKGYRAVPLRDYLDDTINLPRGLSPVVLTFDDSTPRQFHEVPKRGAWVLDSQCTLGILEAFHKQHPDFGLAAVFYVNFSPRPFGQPRLSAAKLQYLAKHGLEIGNHTYHHPFLSRLSEEGAMTDIAMCQAAAAKAVPGYRMHSMALPYGVNPRAHGEVSHGEWDGVSYWNDAVMLAGGGPAPSPNSRRRHLMEVPRVVGSRPELLHWLSYFDHHPLDRYVSDGEPGTVTVPASLLAGLDRRALKGRALRVLGALPPVRAAALKGRRAIARHLAYAAHPTAALVGRHTGLATATRLRAELRSTR